MAKLILLSLIFLGAPIMTAFAGLIIAILARLGCVRTIFHLPLKANQLQNELRCLPTTMLTHTVIAGIFVASGCFSIMISPSLANLGLSVFIGILIQEIWYYISHRLMHVRRLFWIAHRQHHRSIICSGATSLSFSIGEKIIFSTGILSLYSLCAWIMGLSFEGIAIAYLFYFFITGIAHYNKEFFPANALRVLGLRILATPTFHALHHTQPNTNFGLYTRLLDMAFTTEHQQYKKLYIKVRKYKGLNKIRE